MARRLPVVVAHATAEIQEARTRISSEFEQELRAMVTEGGPMLSCKKGCNNCCRHPVTISIAEGLVLYNWLVERGRWTPSLRKQLKETSNNLFGLSFEMWLLSNQPCVFLGTDGLCQVYTVRPMQCRTAFSVEDASECHPHNLRPGSILGRSEQLAEFGRVEMEAYKKLRVKHWQMPIATALLLSAKLESGEIDIEQVDQDLVREYVDSA